MSRQPLVHLAAVPRLVLHCPGVAGGGNLLRTALAGVKMEGKHVSTGIDCVRLIEDRFSVGQCESAMDPRIRGRRRAFQNSGRRSGFPASAGPHV